MKQFIAIISLIPFFVFSQNGDEAIEHSSSENQIIIDMNHPSEQLQLGIPHEFPETIRVEILDSKEHLLVLAYVNDLTRIENHVNRLSAGQYHLNVYLSEGIISKQITKISGSENVSAD